MMPQIKYDKAMLGKMKSNYFNAKALYECIKEQAEEIQRKVLAENPFYIEDEMLELRERRGYDRDKRIYEPDETYLMSEDDFQKYLDLIYPEYVKAGIADKRGRDYIPEAEAKDLMWEAEKQLVEYGIDIMPDEYSEQKETLRKAVRNIKYKDKVLNFVLMLESEEVENYAKN